MFGRTKKHLEVFVAVRSGDSLRGAANAFAALLEDKNHAGAGRQMDAIAEFIYQMDFNQTRVFRNELVSALKVMGRDGARMALDYHHSLTEWVVNDGLQDDREAMALTREWSKIAAALATLRHAHQVRIPAGARR